MHAIHVTARIDYLADAELTPGLTQVHGRLADGRPVDVVSHRDCSVLGRGDVHTQTLEAWLHDSVLVLDGGDGAAPLLVVPTLDLTVTGIAEALRRWLRTPAVPTAA